MADKAEKNLIESRTQRDEKQERRTNKVREDSSRSPTSDQ